MSTNDLGTPTEGTSRGIIMLVSHEPFPIIPHSDFGDRDCCGCLFGVTRGDLAEIVCNECLVVVRTVPASDLQRTLDEMELEADLVSAVCPHCGATHLAPGFLMLMGFVCDNCGEAVKVSDDPGVEQILGEMEEIDFEPRNEPLGWVCTSHECKRGSHHECKAILSFDPATGKFDPPAEIAKPAFCICPCHEVVGRG